MNIIVEGNVITPSEGYKYVTNGEVWSTLVYLGRTDSVDNWHDTNEETPEPEIEEEATISDYEAALAELGVSE